ncbi:hypothetical protein MHI32_01485 [Paenibacillus sp. FSL H7-0690]|uniref:hypothetical protein n=1 Tax=Paenibacillus sp. FSL H7-0690 TaxID=2921437 RepID=UPI0030ECC0DD
MGELDGYTIQVMREAAQNQAEYYENMNRPSYIFKPSLTVDGNQWCALFGENLQDGVAGFGDTPEDAYRDFDNNWRNSKVKYLRVSATDLTESPSVAAAETGIGGSYE